VTATGPAGVQQSESMARARSARSVLATLVGYVLIAVLAYVLLGAVIGTLRWIVRTVLVVVVIGALLSLYLRLKSPHHDP
jgi:hypothetical protein